jgi:hypothetical protein
MAIQKVFYQSVIGWIDVMCLGQMVEGFHSTHLVGQKVK